MNKDPYKNLKPGTIYSIYENEKPVPKNKDVTIYNKFQKKVSVKGNLFITRICICKKCKFVYEAKLIRSDLCPSCQNKKNNKNTFEVDEKVFEGLDPEIVYVVYENQEPVPATEDIKLQKVINKKHYKVSKKGNIFIAKVSICGCGIRKVSKNLKNPYCYECRNNNVGLPVVSLSETRRVEQKKADLFEKNSREITDCTKRNVCLIKYQDKKFIPCYECNDYDQMDIEGILHVADGFKVERSANA